MRKKFGTLTIASALAAVFAFTSAASAVKPATHNGPSVEDKHAAEADTANVVHCFRSSLNSKALLSGKGWGGPGVNLRLAAQRLVRPTGGGSTNSVDVRAVSTVDGTAFRFEWADPTPDDGRRDSKFKDALAIEFPVDSSGDTRLAMGHSGGPVNILHWSAESSVTRKAAGMQAEELVAAGMYDRARKQPQFQQLQCNARWHDGTWTVIIFKPRNEADAASPKFDSGAEIPMALAVWNGSANERLGMKSVSNWIYLHVD